MGNLGTPLSSMNLDELLENACSDESNHSIGMTNEDPTQVNPVSLQRHQDNLSSRSERSRKTVDEVWKDIQRSIDNKEMKCQERQPTLGEITFEDFLVEEGIISELSSIKENIGPKVNVGSNVVVSQFASQSQLKQYLQANYEQPQQSLVGNYVYSQNILQPLHMEVDTPLNVPFANIQVSLCSPVIGTLSNVKKPIRKWEAPEDMVEEKHVKRQQRMIKNRESAARIREKKKAYITGLEIEVSCLEEENEKLRKLEEFENILSNSSSPLESIYQIRRASSALF